MLEIPEARTMAKQLAQSVAGTRVTRVLPPTKPHKFCFYSHAPELYDEKLRGAKLTGARGFGMFCDMEFESGIKLSINDGVNLRLVDAESAPKGYQLLISLEGGKALVFTIAMYGGITLREGVGEDGYYIKSMNSIPFDAPDFKTEFERVLNEAKPTLSAKAFLATEQRFPGVGNGVIQDILFTSGVNPRRKIGSLSSEELEKLYGRLVATLSDMTARGGRDVEKDLFGAPGGYKTLLSKNTFAGGCPVCGAPITKEAYLGGSVYYCPRCQILK